MKKSNGSKNQKTNNELKSESQDDFFDYEKYLSSTKSGTDKSKKQPAKNKSHPDKKAEVKPQPVSLPEVKDEELPKIDDILAEAEGKSSLAEKSESDSVQQDNGVDESHEIVDETLEPVKYDEDFKEQTEISLPDNKPSSKRKKSRVRKSSLPAKGKPDNAAEETEALPVTAEPMTESEITEPENDIKENSENKTESPNSDKSDELHADIKMVDETNMLNPKQKRSAKKHRSIKPDMTEAAASIINALDEALDEDVSEIIEEVAEAEAEIPSENKPHGFKRRAYFTVGVLVTVMAIIGFIFSVNFCVGVITSVADNTPQKNEFAKVVYPMVIIDPAPFDSTSQLSSETVITAAIWDIILYGDKDKYPQEYGVMTVPAIDVELYATNLLGTGLVFEHKSIGNAELGFYYDEETKSYNIPVSPKYFPYSPYIDSIKRSGDTYTLKVGYVSPNPAWLSTDEDDKPQPDKYMEYVISKNGKSYTILSISEIEGSYIPNPY